MCLIAAEALIKVYQITFNTFHISGEVINSRGVTALGTELPIYEHKH